MIKALLKKGYYELSPKKAYKKLTAHIILSITAVLIGFAFASATDGITVVTGIAALVAVFVYMALMTKRSQEGNMLVEHMEGLKMYLGFAEKDRIAMQDAVAAPLAPHSGQPTRDVEFFEKLLPYAVAVGVEKTWAKAFSDIYTEEPDWFRGNWTAFNTARLASSIADTTKVASSSFTAPSSSGGSGFSGGGAGGGGGGGGGGGW